LKKIEIFFSRVIFIASLIKKATGIQTFNTSFKFGLWYYDSLHLLWHALIEADVVPSFTIADMKQPMLAFLLIHNSFSNWLEKHLNLLLSSFGLLPLLKDGENLWNEDIMKLSRYCQVLSVLFPLSMANPKVATS
jgi:hypothetical protein